MTQTLLVEALSDLAQGKSAKTKSGVLLILFLFQRTGLDLTFSSQEKKKKKKKKKKLC